MCSASMPGWRISATSRSIPRSSRWSPDDRSRKAARRPGPAGLFCCACIDQARGPMLAKSCAASYRRFPLAQRPSMQGKIAVEEHFRIEETKGSEQRYPGSYWTGLSCKLLEVHGGARLAEMDAAGIEIAVLSLNSNAVQGVYDTGKAIALARQANDALAAAVAKRPDRFAGLAALPMQDPQAAAAELSRCLRELNFKRALVNGFSQVGAEDSAVYYDLPQYRPFWAEVERLGVPFYLHPRDQLASRRQAYEGHTYLVGSPWGFADETAIHALRLMGSGLFDEFPKLKIVLGHLGERIPYDLWRLDHRLAKVPNRPAKRAMGEYFRSRPVRRISETEDRARPPRRAHSVRSVAARPSPRQGAEPAGQARHGRVFPISACSTNFRN